MRQFREGGGEREKREREREHRTIEVKIRKEGAECGMGARGADLSETIGRRAGGGGRWLCAQCSLARVHRQLLPPRTHQRIPPAIDSCTNFLSKAHTQKCTQEVAAHERARNATRINIHALARVHPRPHTQRVSTKSMDVLGKNSCGVALRSDRPGKTGRLTLNHFPPGDVCRRVSTLIVLFRV